MEYISNSQAQMLIDNGSVTLFWLFDSEMISGEQAEIMLPQQGYSLSQSDAVIKAIEEKR